MSSSVVFPLIHSQHQPCLAYIVLVEQLNADCSIRPPLEYALANMKNKLMNSIPTNTDSGVEERQLNVSTAIIDSEGVVRWTYHKGAVVGIDQAEKRSKPLVLWLTESCTSASGNPYENKVLCSSISAIKSVTREARALLGSDAVSDRWCVSGLALIIQSVLTK